MSFPGSEAIVDIFRKTLSLCPVARTGRNEHGCF